MTETTKKRVTLYVHEKIVRTYDYGEFLCERRGIAWSGSGDPNCATGFESRTIADVLAKAAEIEGFGEAFEIVVGPTVERSHDMNPHGHI